MPVASLVALLAGTVIQAGTSPAAVQPTTSAGYSQAVTRICVGALLFSGQHRIGTRAGAIAVSKDISATGNRRLRRVDAIPKPSGTARLAAAWIRTERRLVARFASAYLQIWYAIERARTRQEKAELPGVLSALVDAPDRLRARAAMLGQRLRVPDCTGGNQSSPQDGNAQRHR
jgi:hypothetical protein